MSVSITFSHLRKMLYGGVMMAILIVGIHHFASVLSWYWIYKWFDIMMHILGGVLVGYFSLFSVLCITYVRSATSDIETHAGSDEVSEIDTSSPMSQATITRHVVVRDFSITQFIVIAAIGGIIIGVLWELLEYMYGLSGLSPERRLDTIADLINDTLGAIMIAIAMYTYYRKKQAHH